MAIVLFIGLAGIRRRERRASGVTSVASDEDTDDDDPTPASPSDRRRRGGCGGGVHHHRLGATGERRRIGRDELRFSPAGLTGTCQVASGTGGYAGMSGHGTSEFAFETGTITFTGVLSS